MRNAWTGRKDPVPREFHFAGVGPAMKLDRGGRYPGEYPSMRFRKVLALRGPSRWGQVPSIEAWVELPQGLENRLTAHPALIDRLTALIEIEPEATVSTCLAGVCVAIQATVGARAEGLCGAWPTSEAGVERVIFPYEEEDTGRDCLEVARLLFLAALEGSAFDLDAEIDRLRKAYQSICLGPSTRSIVEAARRRNIPFRRLTEGSLVQFGQGALQRRVIAAETDRTGAVAQEVAQDKELTRELLGSIGVPVPQGRPVLDAEDAVSAALEIGGPVVVKPQFGNQGRGVATNLRTPDQIRAAYAAAVEHSSTASVIVERFAPGGDYRVLVIGGKVIAAARREPAHVKGDGTHSIRELVDQVNRDPRR
ncbi:MAG TPA: acetate--CoA ligase family protein, partial [Isosphaeraceae bacterium]|nr:acetate--CoA ligase family protein [Isosphaeraceae bacterium]